MVNLKQTLKKLIDSEVTPKNSDAILSALEEANENVEKLNKEDIEALLNYQDKDGGFSISPQFDLDNDIGFSLHMKPSYLISGILIKLSNKGIYETDIKIMNKALNFCAKNELQNYGDYSLEDEILNTIFFEECGVLDYFDKHKEVGSDLSNVIYANITSYRKKLYNCRYLGPGLDEVTKMVLFKAASFESDIPYRVKKSQPMVTVVLSNGLLARVPMKNYNETVAKMEANIECNKKKEEQIKKAEKGKES